MSSPSNTPTQSLTQRQHAFLLHQLASNPEGRLAKATTAKSYPKKTLQELQLNAATLQRLLPEMQEQGWVETQKHSKTNTTATITDAGRQKLQSLTQFLPLQTVPDERMSLLREAYILNLLQQALKQTIARSALDAALRTKPSLKELREQHPEVIGFRDQRCLRLNLSTTRHVLTELVLRGEVHVRRADDAESYTLTPQGVERLKTLRAECPILPPTGKPTAPPSDSIKHAREAFLLLKVFEASAHNARPALGISYPKHLKLNHATAWQVQNELVQSGIIRTHWTGTDGIIIITPAGQRHLTTLSFDAFDEVKIQGRALTQLLKLARESTTVAPAIEPKQDGATPTTAELERAVMSIFKELSSGRFATARMVPIHEVRTEIAKQFGETAASHPVFDEILLQLRRTRVLRLISIDDRSRATAQQLQDSIVAVGETFFDIEK